MGERSLPTIMITGGCGFISSNFVNFMQKESKMRIVVYDNMTIASNKLNLEPSNITVTVAGDICNRKLLDKTLCRYNVEAVIHFAALTHVCDSYKTPCEFVRTNVEGTVTLLEAVRTYGHIKRFLYVSTDEVYGESSRNGDPKKETDLPKPTNPYSASKLSAENFIESYRMSYGVPASYIRMCNIYGPNQSGDKVIPKFIGLAAKEEPFTIQGDGSQLRSWLYVSDACRAIYTVFKEGVVGEIYNASSSTEISIINVAKEVQKAVNSVLGRDTSKFETVSIPDRPFNDQRYCMDSTKLKCELGWSELESFEIGIKKVVEWYITNEGRRAERERVLVYGAQGWIGGQFIQLLKEEKVDYVIGSCRIGDDPDSAIEEEILMVAPTHVASFIGRTHGPGNNTVDYLEGGPDKLTINLRDNLYGPLVLAEVCRKFNIHFTYIGSGCLFSYSDEYPVGSSPMTEDDVPNYFGSSYSVVKGYTDRLMHHYGNVLNIRMRLPISNDVNSRNLITKLASYPKIMSIPNSVTVLPELLPALLDLMRRRHTGTVNLVNHGSIEHSQILSDYEKYVDPSHSYELVGIDDPSDFARGLRKKRSNCFLDTTILAKLCPEVSSSKDAVAATMKVMGASANK